MIAEAFEYVINRLQPKPAAPDAPYVILPSEVTLHDLTEYQEKPRRRAAAPVFHAAASFIEYVNLHKTPDTRIFATSNDALAIFDHLPAKEGVAWRGHRAKFAFHWHPQFIPWNAAIKNKTPFGQAEFADFIDDHRDVIVEPEAAVITEAAVNLQENRTLSVASKINRANGKFHFTYSEDGATGQAAVPEKLTISVPIYRGDDAINIEINIRYRLKDGHVAFSLVSPGLQHLIDNLTAETFDRITEKTDIVCLLGVDG